MTPGAITRGVITPGAITIADTATTAIAAGIAIIIVRITGARAAA